MCRVGDVMMLIELDEVLLDDFGVVGDLSFFVIIENIIFGYCLFVLK